MPVKITLKDNMTESERSLWQWLAKQGPKTILATFSAAEVDPEKLFPVIKSMKHEVESVTSRKLKRAKPLEDLGLVHELRLDRMKKVKKAKKAKKAIAIERQFFAIQKLREKGASWNDVVSYLKRYNKLKVTREYLYKVMLQLAEKYGEANEDT